MDKFRRDLLVAAVMSGALVNSAGGSTPIPVTDNEIAVAPLYVIQMTTGASTDSFALRVSICGSSDTRNHTTSFLVIEELRRPIPEPHRTVEHTKEAIRVYLEDIESEWLVGAMRIDGQFLNE